MTSTQTYFSDHKIILGRILCSLLLASFSAVSKAQAINYDLLETRQSAKLTAYKASTYVPLDNSWIYPAFDKLAALGYLPSSSSIILPWTRLECARLLAEAHSTIDDPDEITTPLLSALDTEFRSETDVLDGDRNTNANTDSIYSRVMDVSGTPLRDGFHFAQTVVNDSGRPYGKGFNSYNGASGRASYKFLAIYARGEFQYASSMPKYSAATQQYIAIHDVAPLGWNLRFGETSRFRPQELYAVLSVSSWQLSFGQQALWLSADRSTSLIWSNNAEALPMFRIARAKPLFLPSFLNHAGPIHIDMFLARQGGIHFVDLGATFLLHGSPDRALIPPPYIWAFAATIKPTKYLEVGFAHTVIFAGYGRPLNIQTFLHTFSQIGNAQQVDPGKRVTGFSFAYHPPLMRSRVVIYTEAMAWNDPIQGKFIARYAFDPGIYMPVLPKIHKIDLRLEGVYTDLPKLPDQGYFYNNAHYVQGYSNYGQILGSWVGPQGIGWKGSSSYWLSARTKTSISHQEIITDQSLYKGGHMANLSAAASWSPNLSMEVSIKLQYGRWRFPLIDAAPHQDFMADAEVRLFPQDHLGS